MNTAALSNFAPAARKQLIEAVSRTLDHALAQQTPDLRTTFKTQVAALSVLNQSDRAGLIERVAYTWFNRFAALRYLDAKGWHPFRARVLTAATPDETQPEILKVTRAGAIPEELKRFTDAARINQILDGGLRSDNPQGEVYRLLVLAACRFYHELLPDLFEKLDDETELLLPDDLLTELSVVQGFRTEIADADCAEVEIIGWLYQFYISKRKAEVMKRKAAVPTEDIPAVTQLFTPHWIVRYLVENSLGRLWLLNRPGSKLREKMPYYIESEAETDFLKIKKPEEIKLLDPAAGSGHMLTYAFDLLSSIYEEEGYAPSEIPALILRHNLHGLEICPRAAQLAELALVFKAREKSRRFFQAGVPLSLVEGRGVRGEGAYCRPRILALQNITFEENELREYIDALDLGDLFQEPILRLLHQFREATTFGSLIQPCLDEPQITLVRRAIEAKDLGGQLFLRETHGKVLRVLEQAEMLCQRYHVVVANPPYMGGGNMSSPLREYAKENYPDSKSDLFSMFMEQARAINSLNGYIAMVTMQNWMFLSSFSVLREKFIEHTSFVTLLQIGYNSFPEMNSKIAQACAFVIKNQLQRIGGTYFNLNDAPQSADKELVFLDKLKSNGGVLAYACDFQKIPGSPIAYWISKAILNLYGGTSLCDYATPRQGLATGDNNQFLRQWHEVSNHHFEREATTIDVARNSGRRWFPTTKGGSFRRWYGNREYVVNWANDGKEIRCFGIETGKVRSRAQNTSFYFSTGATWSTISSGPISFRLSEKSIFETKGSMCFSNGVCSLEYLIGVLNTKVTQTLLAVASPTLDYHEGPLSQIPVKSDVSPIVIERNVIELISLARTDWDNFETSWDFRDLPLLRSAPELVVETRDETVACTQRAQFPLNASLQQRWEDWRNACAAAIRRMQELETENNRLFIDAYGLADELKPDVPEDQITLARADARKDMAAFLSYAVGCMMGRYSLDAPGLILANAGDTVAHYYAKVFPSSKPETGNQKPETVFAPDEDGIIPVLDGEWFEDDIVARTREFLRATFGETTLRDNLRFIETSLGKDLRKYYLADFYKNHLSNERAFGYKKRPIYWLIQSPDKGFSALLYLHRYTKDTLNLVLNRYLRPYYQEKLPARLAHLNQSQASESTSTRDKTAARKEAEKLTRIIHECEEWERQTLLPLAQQRIELDLDDGVKVNYMKLGEALAPIPGFAAEEEES